MFWGVGVLLVWFGGVAVVSVCLVGSQSCWFVWWGRSRVGLFGGVAVVGVGGVGPESRWLCRDGRRCSGLMWDGGGVCGCGVGCARASYSVQSAARELSCEHSACSDVRSILAWCRSRY